jgi:hypothetical protein
MSTQELKNSSGKRVHTFASEKSEGRTVLRICKDIRSYVNGIDSQLSKIKSARDHISNLLEVLASEIESIAAKKEISWNTEESQEVQDAVEQMGIEQHGTNLQVASELLSDKANFLQGATTLLKKALDVGTSPDLRCYETISPSSPLPKGLTFLSGGTMVNLGPESLVELSKSSPELIEKMLELSGGMVICSKESV